MDWGGKGGERIRSRAICCVKAAAAAEAAAVVVVVAAAASASVGHSHVSEHSYESQ